MIRAILCAVGLLCQFPAFGGGNTGIGNGGDHVRFRFIEHGQAVVRFLESQPPGKELALRENLNLNILRGTLELHKIFLRFDPLKDRQGSIVDSIGEPGRIFLSVFPWRRHFDTGADVHYLVFHEMLRSAGVDDDGYRLSKKLKPFPQELRSPELPRAESELKLLSPVAQVSGADCLSGRTTLEHDSRLMSLIVRFEERLPGEKNLTGAAGCRARLKLEPPQGYFLKPLVIDAFFKAGPERRPISALLETELGERTTGPARERAELKDGLATIRFSGELGQSACPTGETFLSLGLSSRSGPNPIGAHELRVAYKLERCPL